MHGNVSDQFSFHDHHTGGVEDVCTHILLNGDPEMGLERSAGARPLVSRIKDPSGSFPDGRIVLAPIMLSNVAPCTGVIVEANFHAPGSDRCRGTRFSGAFAAGAEGLHAMGSTCDGCNRHDLVKDRVCVAVESGRAPDANASLVRPNAVIELNTGDFALKTDDSTRVVARRVRAPADFSGKATSLLASGQALNARAFGAKGDGITDDAPALQKAIDAAQLSRQKLALPAGVYLVKTMLKVRYNGPVWDAATKKHNSPWKNCTFNATDSVMIPGWCPSALHLVGDGGWGLETAIKAGALMDAVIDVGFGPQGPSVPRAGPGMGHEFRDFSLDVGSKAEHGLRAYAIIRSLVSGLTVIDAAHVGVEMGYGFINRM